MATKQTRRSISVRGTTYDHLRRFSEAEARSMSDIVEELLARLFDGGKAATPTAPVLVKAEPVRQAARESAPRPAPVRAVAPARNRRSRTVAAKIVRAPLQRTPPEQSGKPSVGRPAPTPASVVAGTRRDEAPKGDYRVIRF